jgi:SAM-dependent methyltransferase
MTAESEWYETNRLSWNAATRQHNRHKGDQAAFLREGGSTLFPEEVELLGNVRDKSLLHLQCNAGQDTLSIAGRLGAEVTGVDISDEAIEFAQRLSRESGIPGEFIHSDVYPWLQNNTRQFDIVFVSYGALVWLDDLTRWGRGVVAALKPGGRLVLVEFHPILGVLDGALAGDWSAGYDYLGGTRYEFEMGVGDYVALSESGLTPTGQAAAAEPFQNPHPCYEFAWGLAEVIMPLVSAGLRLTFVQEYSYSNGFKPYSQLIELPGRRWTFPPEFPRIPLMYAIQAQK